MKKALCLFLAAALALTLCACGAPETAIQKLEGPPAAQDAESAPAAELPDEPPAAEAAGESASDHAGHSQSSAGVSVPAPEQGENLVWIPTNGGTKYHTSAKCCNMKNPIQVTLETALANGFTPCKRCH